MVSILTHLLIILRKGRGVIEEGQIHEVNKHKEINGLIPER